MRKVIERLDRGMEPLLGVAAGVLLFCMMSVTFVDVVLRYIFNAPLRGSFEVTELMLVVLIFAALPLVSRREEHVVMDFLDRYIGPRLEMPPKAEFALIKAHKGDHAGNLVYRKTARNFSPMMATAARVTIAEVEHLVEPGELDADRIHTPGIFVRHLFEGSGYQNRIERRTTRKA